jgi:hypothetical protein
MKLPSFKNRPPHTVLFIADEKSYRLDADSKGSVLSDLQEIAAGCATPAKLAACISAVAAATPAFGRKTWVLFARLPVQLLTLPAMQVAGIKKDLLLQALQFELEGATGQAAAGRTLAYRLVNTQDELNQYWLTHVDALALDDILAALHKAGSALGGLLHPGGLPLFIVRPEQQDWLRIEVWPEQALGLRRENGDTDMRLFALENRHWHTALENWQRHAPQTAASETLLNNTIEVLPDTQRTFHLYSADDVALWLGLWAQTLTAKQAPPVPLLEPPPLFNRELALRIASGAGMLLLCLAHLVWNLRQANYYKAETEALKKADQDMQALRKEITEQGGEKQKLEDKLAKLQGNISAIPKTLTALQQRPAKLLESLAKGRPDDLVVEEIVTEKDTVTVKGVALQSGLANQLGASLEAQLAVLNWQVGAPAKEDMRLFEDGGPWSFSVALLDRGLEGFGGSESGAKPGNAKQ